MHTEQIINGLNKFKAGQQIDDAELRYRICEEAKKAVEKQVPKKPKNIKPSPNSDPYYRRDEKIGFCPNCGKEKVSSEHHCQCGQALDWSEK